MPAKRDKRLKKANIETEMTPRQVREFKKCFSDPVYFICNYMYVQHPKRGRIKFAMYDYQIDLVRNYQKNRYNIVLMPRQTGKSITSVGFLLWKAIFTPDSNILIVSNKLKSAANMIKRAKYAYEELPYWLKPGIKDDDWTKHRLGWDNESLMQASATTEDAGRSDSISLLFADELAFVRPSMQNEFWQAILPTLSTGGNAIIASTPNGSSNLFASLWRRAIMSDATGEHVSDAESLGFVPTTIKWNQVPGRDEAFKKQTIALTSELAWKQEYECQFLSSEALLIDSVRLEDIKPILINPIKSIHGVKFFQKIEEETTYVLGVDPSTGTGSDYSVINVFKFEDLSQVAEYRSNVTSSPDLYVVMRGLINYIENHNSEVMYSIENNGVGEGMIALYQVDEKPPVRSDLVSEGKRLGFTTTRKTKMRTCLALKNLIEKSKIIIYSKVLHAELGTYIRTGTSGYEAQYGSTDDVISSVLICLRVIEEMADYDETAHDKLYHIDDGDIGSWDDNFDDTPMPIVM